jgi:hypothetical protein
MKKYSVLAVLAAFTCLMAFLSLGKTPDARADDDDEGAQATFKFTVLSQAHKHPETHQVVLSGCGKFSKKNVEGGGRFTHWIVAAKTPFPVVDHGTWKAKKLLSFTPLTPPPYAEVIGGVLKMNVDLIPDGKPVIKGVTMTVVCNIPPAGKFTGQAEGVILDKLDGLTFVQSGTGVTQIEIPRDEDDD